MENSAGRIYAYRSPFGMVSIRKNLGHQDNWILCFETFERATNGERLSSTQPVSLWPTAEEAARAVLRQETRFPFWDELPFVVFPTSLDDWQSTDGYGSVPI